MRSTTDLVPYLRELADRAPHDHEWWNDFAWAADEIERLRAEVVEKDAELDALRRALLVEIDARKEQP